MNLLEIKTLPIKDVIDRIGLEYTGGPVERKIKENGQPTSGWTFNTSKNLAKDFSKDRPDGHNFWVVKTHFNLTDSETYKRFEDNFGTGEKESGKPSITQIWKGLHDLDQNQKQYLAKRFIDYELVKDCVKSYNGAIGCMVYDGELPMGINCRRINSTGKDDRFVSYPGYPTSGVYKSGIDSKIKKIYVVEGLIDFLSLRQATTNVIGLKSADSGYKDILRLYKEGYEIFLVKDNDVAGDKIIKQLNGISFKMLNPGYVDPKAKDTNDLLCALEGDTEMVIAIIEEHSKYVTPIDGIFDELYEEQKIIQEQGKLGFDGPFPFYDTNCSGVVPGRLYMIGAFSNVGKSKFAYYHAQRFMKQGHKVCFITLEDGRTDVLREIIFSYDNVSIYEWKSGRKPNKGNYKNLVIRDDLYNIRDIVSYVESIDCGIVFIDYVQNIQDSGSMYEKNANIAITLQRLATSTNKVIYALSQISNEQKKTGQDEGINLKGAGEYFASAHYVFGLGRDDLDKKLELRIHKTKGGHKDGFVHKFKVDYSKNQFEYEKPKTF